MDQAISILRADPPQVNGQWNIPRLRTLLDEVLSNHHPVHDFDVEHDFPAIGKKRMLLNAQRFVSVDGQSDLTILVRHHASYENVSKVTKDGLSRNSRIR